MEARRTLRRKIVLIALAGIFSVAALILLLVGLARLRSIQRLQSGLHEEHRELLSYVGQMRQEVTLLELGVEAASAERLQGLVEECTESFGDLRKDFGDILEEQPAYESTEEEWSELSSPGRNNWTRYGTDLSAFEGHLECMREGIEEELAVAQQAGRLLCGAGVVAAALTSLLCVWVLLTVLSDIVSETYDPEGLAREVESLAENNQFKSRIQLLLQSRGSDDTADNWQVELTRRFPEKRTHVCFEALASSDGNEVKLWGRRYKWAGFVKSHQRLFFPAFGEATWRALCLMHNNRSDCPVPVAFKKLRAGPFKVGAVILMEHMGEVHSVRKFLKSGFCLLSGEQQDHFLKRVVSFLSSLHEIGIYGVKPRYLHGQNMGCPGAETRLYLFDLDKVLLWKSCPSWFSTVLVCKDHCRLMRALEPVLSAERLETVRSWLREGRSEKCDGGT